MKVTMNDEAAVGEGEGQGVTDRVQNLGLAHWSLWLRLRLERSEEEERQRR